MKYIMLLSTAFLLFSCGTSNNFAKRKYTKGIYIEKHSTAKTKKSKPSRKKDQNIITVQKEGLVQKERENDHKFELENKAESSSEKNLGTSLPADNILNDTQKVEENEENPPEVNDGETLEKGDQKEPLGLVAFILAFVAVGAYAVATVSNVFIYLFSVSGTVALGFTILSFAAIGLAVVAVVLGAVSYSRVKTGKAKAAIIIGSILIGVFLLTLLFAFLFI